MKKESAEALADLGKEAIKEIGKPVYEDGVKPVLAPTGQTLGLVPRAIKAALAPLERWILTKEYNIEETKKLLEQKLADVPPEQIVPPEPYVAVPAIQYISYCMDSEVLRDMYAELLAKSMQEATKDGVHPGFLEIIKQLCPDEARLLKYIYNRGGMIPSLAIDFDGKIPLFAGKAIYEDVIDNWSNIYEVSGCEATDCEHICQRLYSLIRLGILKKQRFFEEADSHSQLIEHPYIKRCMSIGSLEIKKEWIVLTEFGRAFCRTCISPQKGGPP